MADKKISELTEATTIEDADLLTIVQSGTNKKVTGVNAKGYFAPDDYKSTGVVTGGGITATPGTTVFDVPAGSGIIWDALTQTETLVTWTQFSSVPIILAPGVPITYVAIKLVTSTPTIVTSPIPFTLDEQQEWLVQGLVEHSTGVINSYSTFGMNVLFNMGQFIHEVKRVFRGIAFKDFQIKYYANGANLNIRRTVDIPPTLKNGKLLSQGTARDSTGYPATPDIGVVVAYDQTPMQYVWINNLGQLQVEAPSLTVKTDKYQNGSATLQTVPAGKFTVQWLITFPSVAVVVYGTRIYDTRFVARKSMLDQKLSTIIKLAADSLGTSRNYDNSVIGARLVTKSGETSLLSPDTLLLNFDEATDDVFVDNVNRGIITQFTVTPTGGLNFNWTAGSVFDQPNAVTFDINASASVAFDNAINYLYWDQSAQLHELSLSTTLPSNPDVFVREILVQNGQIYEVVNEPELVIREADIEDAGRKLHPAGGFEGMLLRADPDVSSNLDIKMTTGSYIRNGNQTITAAELLSRTTNMPRWYHSGGSVVNDTNANVDPANFDNGTDRVAVSPSSKFKVDYFLFTKCTVFGSRVHYFYGQNVYGTEAEAKDNASNLAINFPFGLPNGLKTAAHLVALVMQGTDITLPPNTSDRWIDLRAGTVGGTGGAALFTDLGDTFSGYTTPNALIGVNGTTNALEEKALTVNGTDTIFPGAVTLTIDDTPPVTNGTISYHTANYFRLRTGGRNLDIGSDAVNALFIAVGTTIVDINDNLTVAIACNINQNLSTTSDVTHATITGTDAESFESTIGSGLAYKVTPTGTDTVYFGRDAGGLNALGFHAVLGTTLSSVAAARVLLDTNNNETSANFQVRHNSPDFNGGSLLFEVSESGQTYILGDLGINNLNPSSALDVAGDIEISSDSAYYYGEPTIDTSWRSIRSGNDLVFQRRESSTWVTKSTISA